MLDKEIPYTFGEVGRFGANDTARAVQLNSPQYTGIIELIRAIGNNLEGIAAKVYETPLVFPSVSTFNKQNGRLNKWNDSLYSIPHITVGHTQSPKAATAGEKYFASRFENMRALLSAIHIAKGRTRNLHAVRPIIEAPPAHTRYIPRRQHVA